MTFRSELQPGRIFASSEGVQPGNDTYACVRSAIRCRTAILSHSLSEMKTASDTSCHPTVIDLQCHEKRTMHAHRQISKRHASAATLRLARA